MRTLRMRNCWTRSIASQLCKSDLVHDGLIGLKFPSTARDACWARYVDDCMTGFCIATFLSNTLPFAVGTDNAQLAQSLGLATWLLLTSPQNPTLPLHNSHHLATTLVRYQMFLHYITATTSNFQNIINVTGNSLRCFKLIVFRPTPTTWFRQKWDTVVLSTSTSSPNVTVYRNLKQTGH